MGVNTACRGAHVHVVGIKMMSWASRPCRGCTVDDVVGNITCRGCTVGDVVGYKVRFDDVTSPATCIKFVTDGTLLREATLADPLLSRYSVIMIDEAHERNMNTDALLGIVKKIRRKRKDLRVIVCSATIDAEKFLDFFIPPKMRQEVVSIGDNKKDAKWT